MQSTPRSTPHSASLVLVIVFGLVTLLAEPVAATGEPSHDSASAPGSSFFESLSELDGPPSKIVDGRLVVPRIGLRWPLDGWQIYDGGPQSSEADRKRGFVAALQHTSGLHLVIFWLRMPYDEPLSTAPTHLAKTNPGFTLAETRSLTSPIEGFHMEYFEIPTGFHVGPGNTSRAHSVQRLYRRAGGLLSLTVRGPVMPWTSSEPSSRVPSWTRPSGSSRPPSGRPRPPRSASPP